MAETGEELVASEGPQKAASASLPASECQRLLSGEAFTTVLFLRSLDKGNKRMQWKYNL